MRGVGVSGGGGGGGGESTSAGLLAMSFSGQFVVR